MQRFTPCLWFDNQAEEAVNFYLGVFKNGHVGKVARYDAASAQVSGQREGSVLTIEFELFGQKFIALNGGPIFKFTEAVSFAVACETQSEIDEIWGKLSAVPESEQCGWLKDKFGLSWQIVPSNIDELVSRPMGMQAMLSMKKLDIAALDKAYQAE